MTIGRGDRIVVVETESGDRHLLSADGGGARKESGLGIVNPDPWVGLPWGSRVSCAGKACVLLPVRLPDLALTLRRKAQIILPKDASRIVFELGVGEGDRVLESGIGSGGATVALAWAVGASGRVVVQELREDFAAWGRENLERAGLGNRIEVHLGDLTVGLAPPVKGPFQACLLDQPEPWRALPHILAALAPGARLAAYCPQVVQVESMVRGLREADFLDVRALELIERGWEVKERGSRPSFDGLGHTGFLVFAQWPGSGTP